MTPMNSQNLEFERCKFSFNPFVQPEPQWTDPSFSFLNASDMMDFHRSLDGYTPTPLVKARDLAHSLGVGMVYVKDESQRFGIKAFKALGASYAIYRFLKERWEDRFGSKKAIPFDPSVFSNPALLDKLGSFTFCAATDGNHGRAVAWTARKLKQKAVIYMPDNTAQARIDNVESEGARVVLVPGTFDDCVTRCAADAQSNNWYAISDTAYPGYMDIPRFIMLGYTTLFRELEDVLHTNDSPQVDFVFLPAGVGGVAAAGVSFYTRKYGSNRPWLICVEPTDCDCFLESVRFGNGAPLPTRGKQTSIMVGLNCGIPSPVAWPIIRDGMHLFTGITDNYVIEAMRAYHREKITSGESGAAGLAGLIALLKDPELREAREQMQLSSTSRILLINTEGDTDPVNYQRIISL